MKADNSSANIAQKVIFIENIIKIYVTVSNFYLTSSISFQFVANSILS